ncbi:VanW family protein [Isoptericola variabilis]|uniref:VanW family protein n=1 Tax=Isoptericola variabilis (strain 225) TaxID=743718 RepID=F6FPT0_ISOV2|nr:VanW family protein [Isoptericola variabilis]AEG43719.1 VanW family protein [Isoptericola variabilis 225]TWH27399.1 vancomycin resistance protein YoaR [Isoptericola variabilis J7]
MGHPTEREPAPDQTTPEPGSTHPDPAADAPYEPQVRAYELRRLGTVSAPRTGPPQGDPTQVLPVVSVPGPGAPASPASAASAPPAPPAGGGSPIAGLEGDGAPSRLPKVAAWTGLGLVVGAGLYVGAQWLVSDKVPQDTTVAGVEIGGMTAPDAVAALERGLGPRAAEPITLTAGDASSTVDPADAGLAFDAQGTVADLTGFSLSPARLWDHLVGAEEVPPAVEVSRGTLDATLEGVAESLRAEPVDGTVTFADGEPVATPSEDGTEVVVEEAADAVTSSWLVRPGPVELPTRPVPPQVDQGATDAALAQAEKIVSAPVRVSVGGQNPELPERVLAEATSFVPADGALEPQFDGDLLTTAIVDRTNDLLSEPDDAHFEFSGGKPVIVGGEPGTTLDPEEVSQAVGAAALGDERATEVATVQKDPETTRQALEELGVKEVVASFSTPLTSEPIRTKNLVRGAQLVTGTLVEPGETFSLLEALSPITLENGYFAAGVVSNGVHTEGVGGGLSQMATTVYNAGYFAGFDDVEHRPHSYWFSRYPAGREATIYVGALDVKFRNDTPYGALMQSWVSGGQVHVAIWSTKYYEVRTSDSGKRDVVPTTTVHRSEPDCEPYPAGNDGFSITNYRKVYRDGELVKDESYSWTYKPDNGIVCDAPESQG